MDLFYGRSHEAASLSALVLENRVVLVYGPAGVGKSALVRAALAHSTPPLLVVSLAGAEDPRAALARIARAMGARPPAVENEKELEQALGGMLSGNPRTLVLDDVTDTALAPMVAHAAKVADEARIILVSRRFFTAREAGVRAAAYEVKPLEREEAVALVRALEKARGRSLAEDLADSTGGNPLLLQLALATPRAALAEDGDAEAALRRSIEGIEDAAGRTIVAALAGAGTALDEKELSRAAGPGATGAIDALRKRLVLTRADGRLALAASVAEIARDVLGAPKPATWKIVQKVADRMLASAAQDDGALLAASRARLELGDAGEALEIVRQHHLARASAEPVALERLLRDIGARSAEHRSGALLVLARESLRIGDYDAARRALDDLPRAKTYEEAERAALLRAECHIRAGEPAAAQRAIDALPARTKKGAPSASPALVLTRAQLATLRGELESSRKTLEALAPQTKDVPPLEARRAVQIAGSYLYEERYDKTHAWVERSRAAMKAAGLRVEPVATILGVHALLGLGEVTRAEEVVAREASGRPHGPMLEVALLVRRGEHAKALAAGDAALASLDRRADLLFRSVVARDLARAAIAMSAYSRAAKFLRLAEVGADEPGLAALRPICDAEEARLSEVRGDRTRAKRAIDRAFARIPRSPFVAVDHATIHGETPAARDDDPPHAFAYAALRAAELDVAAGRLASAIASAERAERFFADAGMRYEAARAALVLGEALARQPIATPKGKGKKKTAKKDASQENGAGNIHEAERALAACEMLANDNDYPFIAASAALVRAYLADSKGDVSSASMALEDAVRIAGAANAVDAALANAARRLGVAVAVPRGDASTPRPFEPLVERLGLARPADVLWRVGDRTFLRARADGPPSAVACTVDVDDRKVEVIGGDSIALPEQRIALLVALAESGGAGATLEELFALVWRGAFHPLRHRNAVYVALTRLKDSLKPFVRDVRLAHDGERYRLVGNAPVAVRRRVSPGEIASLVRDGAGPMIHDHDHD